MLGFALLVLAALAWIAAGFAYDLSTEGQLGLFLLAAGFGVAAWGVRGGEAPRGWLASGLAVVVVGTLLFLGNDFGDLSGSATRATHVFLTGAVVATAAQALAVPEARAAGTRVGLALVGVAGVLWVVADWESLLWQPGNVAAAVGGIWVAAKGP